MLLWGHGAAFHGLLITISGKCYERGWRLYRAARTNVCRRNPTRFLVGRLPVGLHLRRGAGHERVPCVLGDMGYTILCTLLHIMVFDHDGGKRGRTAKGDYLGTVWAQFLGGNYVKNICA